jgi:hypothetical protein
MPGINKLALLHELLPDDGNVNSGVTQSLHESLISSGEKGLHALLEDFLGQMDTFCLVMDSLAVKIHREDTEALTTK